MLDIWGRVEGTNGGIIGTRAESVGYVGKGLGADWRDHRDTGAESVGYVGRGGGGEGGGGGAAEKIERKDATISKI